MEKRKIIRASDLLVGTFAVDPINISSEKPIRLKVDKRYSPDISENEIIFSTKYFYKKNVHIQFVPILQDLFQDSNEYKKGQLGEQIVNKYYHFIDTLQESLYSSGYTFAPLNYFLGFLKTYSDDLQKICSLEKDSHMMLKYLYGYTLLCFDQKNFFEKENIKLDGEGYDHNYPDCFTVIARQSFESVKIEEPSKTKGYFWYKSGFNLNSCFIKSSHSSGLLWTKSEYYTPPSSAFVLIPVVKLRDIEVSKLTQSFTFNDEIQKLVKKINRKVVF